MYKKTLRNQNFLYKSSINLESYFNPLHLIIITGSSFTVSLDPSWIELDHFLLSVPSNEYLLTAASILTGFMFMFSAPIDPDINALIPIIDDSINVQILVDRINEGVVRYYADLEIARQHIAEAWTLYIQNSLYLFQNNYSAEMYPACVNYANESSPLIQDIGYRMEEFVGAVRSIIFQLGELDWAHDQIAGWVQELERRYGVQHNVTLEPLRIPYPISHFVDNIIYMNEENINSYNTVYISEDETSGVFLDAIRNFSIQETRLASNFFWVTWHTLYEFFLSDWENMEDSDDNSNNDLYDDDNDDDSGDSNNDNDNTD